MKAEKDFLAKKNYKNSQNFSCSQLFFPQFDLQFDLKSSMLPKLRVVDPWRYFFVHTFAEKVNFHEINQKCQIFFYPFLMNLDLQSWSLAFYVTQTRHFKPLKLFFFYFHVKKILTLIKKKSQNQPSYIIRYSLWEWVINIHSFLFFSSNVTNLRLYPKPKFQ